MSPNIRIVARREDPFARITKSMLSDSRISWEAKGILSYLLGKPEDWKLRVSDLVKHGTAGERKIRAALNELRAFGYADLVQDREGGRIVGWTWRLCDYPIFSPDCGFEDVENEDLQNSHSTKNDDTKNDFTKRTKATGFPTEKPVGGSFRKNPIPSEEEFEEFVEHEELDNITNGRPSLYGDMIDSGWKDGRGKRINDWRAYVRGLEQTMEDAKGR